MHDILDRLHRGLIARWPDLGPLVARLSLVVVFAWLGVMQFFGGADRMAALLEDHLLLPSSAEPTARTWVPVAERRRHLHHQGRRLAGSGDGVVS